ncbi:MAG: EF-hand domain-containing protein [Rhizorhabdus sp.]
MRYALLFLALSAMPLAAKKAEPLPAICLEPVKPQLFMSPLGEPFRPKGDADDPVRRWFDQADRDHDGKLTMGEMMLDADRFFARLDSNGDGELLPGEVHAYEDDVPEIRLYQRRRDPGAASDRKADEKERLARQQATKRKSAGPAYDGAMGAGRYAFLNIPNPVAAADSDINRAVSAKEFRGAAAERFRDLDPNQFKALSFALLPKTPAQVAANSACLESVRQQAKERRR